LLGIGLSMKLLSPLDLMIIVLYLAGITWIGARFYRKDADLKEYLLGSNVMKWFPVALSILATDTSAITYLGSPAWAFQHDMKLSLGMLACFFAVPIVIWLFLPVYSKGNLYTGYQYLEKRFDSRVRVIASVFFLVVRGCHVAIVIYVPALVMSELLHLPLKFSVLAIGALTATYTSFGGIKAVIWTDTLQVGVVFLGLGLLATSALGNVPGGLHEVWAIGQAHNKFELFDFSVNWSSVDNFWALIVGGTMIYVQGMSTDQAILQKYFTTRSSRETTKALLLYIAVVMILVVLLSLLGVILFVFYFHHPEIRATLQNPDAVVPHYAAKMLPHGLTGLVIASILAGSMSTVSASINSLATSTVLDIYQRFPRTPRSEQHYVRASRWATLVWGMLATVGALYAPRLGTLVLAFTRVQSLMGGVILGIFLLGVTNKQIGASEVIGGTVFGSASVVYCAVYTPVSMYWYSVIGCFSTILFSWLCNRSGLLSAGGYLVKK